MITYCFIKFKINTLDWTTTLVSVLALLGLAGCGGAISDLGSSADVLAGSVKATGYFKDSAVEGVHYESGNTVGITDTNGAYTYEVIEPVRFFIGGVGLRTITQNKFITTPVNLTSQGNTANLQVLNITRFLMMLDDNGNPDDGIVISEAVQAIADQWSQVDFTTTDLPTELAGIISDAASADGTAHLLPDADTAKSHLESTLQCLHSGVFQGRLAGNNVGSFAIHIDVSTGTVNGKINSIINNVSELRDLTGSSTLDFTQNQIGLNATDSAGVQYSFRYTTLNQIDGDWIPPGGSPGTLSGGRTANSIGALYRISGQFDGDDQGILGLDIPITGTIRGQMYSLTSDFTQTINASLDSNQTSTVLTIIGEDGSTTFTGTLDTTAGTMSGTWTNQFADPNNPNFGGTFSGTGCRLIP